jgi:hypothetical protein
MTFPDRLYIFIEYLPWDLYIYIRDNKIVIMEDVYSSARDWIAHRNIGISSNFGNTNINVKKSIKSFFKAKDKTNKEELSEDELDLMDAKQLVIIIYYNYQKKDHLARDYPSSRKSDKDKKSVNFKVRTKSLYRTEETEDSEEL